MADRRTHQDYVLAAADAYDRLGPAGSGLAMTMSGVARIASTSRTAIYKLWGTAEELNADLIEFGCTFLDDWRGALLASPSSATLEDALARAVGRLPAQLGVIAGATVVGWPEASDGRLRVGALDEWWVDRCAAWLREHASEIGVDAPDEAAWPELALGLTALVEGVTLWRYYLDGLSREGWTDVEATDLARVAVAFLQELAATAVPLDRSSMSAAADGAPDRWTARQRELMAAVIDRVAHVPFGDPGAPPASRLVNADRLARSLGVTSRRLTMVWPTTSDLNADLVEHMVRRLRAEAQDYAAVAATAALSRQYEFFSDLFVSVFDAIVVVGSRRSASTHLAAALTMADPTVRTRALAVLQEWVDAQKMALLAILQAIGYHLRPEVDADAYTELVFAAAMGAQRLTALLPHLADRRVTYLGSEHPALPAGLSALCRALTTICSHEPIPVHANGRRAPGLGQ